MMVADSIDFNYKTPPYFLVVLLFIKILCVVSTIPRHFLTEIVLRPFLILREFNEAPSLSFPYGNSPTTIFIPRKSKGGTYFVFVLLALVYSLYECGRSDKVRHPTSSLYLTIHVGWHYAYTTFSY